MVLLLVIIRLICEGGRGFTHDVPLRHISFKTRGYLVISLCVNRHLSTLAKNLTKKGEKKEKRFLKKVAKGIPLLLCSSWTLNIKLNKKLGNTIGLQKWQQHLNT